MEERVKMAVEIDATVAAAAVAKGLDLSEELERALRRLLGMPRELSKEEQAAEEEAARWHDAFVAKHGRWTDGLDKL